MKQEKISSKFYVKYEIIFKKISEIEIDLFNNFLIEIGIGSLEEIDGKFYFYIDYNLKDKLLNSIKEYLIKNKIDFKIVKIEKLDESFLYEWQKFHTPVIIDNFLIKPSWFNLNEIILDSSLAFGTGKHPTTQMCIEFIIKLVKNQKISSFIDCGCGSGILSIIANKLNIENIVSFDKDFQAVEIANKNFKINNCQNIINFCGSFEALKELKFDLVCANMLSGIILKYKNSLLKLVKENGYLIISGIEKDEGTNFLNKFNFKNLQKLEKKEKDNWITFLFKHF